MAAEDERAHLMISSSRLPLCLSSLQWRPSCQSRLVYCPHARTLRPVLACPLRRRLEAEKIPPKPRDPVLLHGHDDPGLCRLQTAAALLLTQSCHTTLAPGSHSNSITARLCQLATSLSSSNCCLSHRLDVVSFSLPSVLVSLRPANTRYLPGTSVHY